MVASSGLPDTRRATCLLWSRRHRSPRGERASPVMSPGERQISEPRPGRTTTGVPPRPLLAEPVSPQCPLTISAMDIQHSLHGYPRSRRSRAQRGTAAPASSTCRHRPRGWSPAARSLGPSLPHRERTVKVIAAAVARNLPIMELQGQSSASNDGLHRPGERFQKLIFSRPCRLWTRHHGSSQLIENKLLAVEGVRQRFQLLAGFQMLYVDSKFDSDC